MAQKRIRQTDTYTQLAPGDPGYINPASVYIAVDSDNFTEDALKMPLDEFYSATHVEKDRLVNLSSHTVTIQFGTAFSSVPNEAYLYVYRIEQQINGYRRQQVLWEYDDVNQPSTTGCNFTIDSSESLTGIIVEYKYE